MIVVVGAVAANRTELAGGGARRDQGILFLCCKMESFRTGRRKILRELPGSSRIACCKTGLHFAARTPICRHASLAVFASQRSCGARRTSGAIRDCCVGFGQLRKSSVAYSVRRFNTPEALHFYSYARANLCAANELFVQPKSRSIPNSCAASIAVVGEGEPSSASKPNDTARRRCLRA